MTLIKRLLFQPNSVYLEFTQKTVLCNNATDIRLVQLRAIYTSIGAVPYIATNPALDTIITQKLLAEVSGEGTNVE